MTAIPQLFVGVDPGLSGAIALFDNESQELVAVHDMPLTTTQAGSRHIDPYAIRPLLYDREVRLALVEKVSGGTYRDATGQVRGQGSAASFNFGKATGIVIGVLAGCRVPVREVHPSVWKALLNLSKEKALSRKKASELFPSHAEKFARAKDDGRAEAALLAWYAAKTFGRFS